MSILFSKKRQYLSVFILPSIIATFLLYSVVESFSIPSVLLQNHYNDRQIIISSSRQQRPQHEVRLSTATAQVNGDSTAASATPPSPPATVSPVENIRLNVNEKARTVTSVCTSGTLCTVSAETGIEGAPFGSFVDYVLDDKGNPILLMNEMSVHTMNIRKQKERNDNAMVTLFTQLGSNNSPVSSSFGSNTNSRGGKGLQDVSRCSLTGMLEKMNSKDPQWDAVRMKYSLTHTYADQVMDSPKFAFYRLTPSKIYFVGGFGVLAKWVDPKDYQMAAPDILAREASEITERVNREHTEDLRYTAQYLLGVTNEIELIRMTNVDRLGMDIRVTSKQGTRRNKLQTDEFRIGFRIPVKSVEDAKSEILKIFQDAWERGNGFTWEDGDDEDDTLLNVPIMKIAADSLE